MIQTGDMLIQALDQNLNEFLVIESQKTARHDDIHHFKGQQILQGEHAGAI